MRVLILLVFLSVHAVELGVDHLEEAGLEGKRVGLITNQTGIDSHLRSTIDVIQARYQLVALFGPEHGLTGSAHADCKVGHKEGEIPVYSLYGETRRPTKKMLEGIDVLVYDIQDVGMRCYTYASTLFYAMEEAAKLEIPVVVLDRPNPINGVIVDGPMLDPNLRSFVGYIDVPVCHGMTIGELATLFNAEYGIGCDLTVVKMRGWGARTMTFADTGLPWVPTSPHIPEASTPLYYCTTGIMGDLVTDVSIGVGYTLPFKVVGAPFIDSKKFADALNAQQFQGVTFQPFDFAPFFGRHAGKTCRGVRIIITDPTNYRPVATQFLIMGILKSLYPDNFHLSSRKEYLAKITGSQKIYDIAERERYPAWKLIAFQKNERAAFLKKREKYLLY